MVGRIVFCLVAIKCFLWANFSSGITFAFLAALSIDRLLAWKSQSSFIDLFISWLAFCVACLIKLLPLIWLGLPLLLIEVNYNQKLSFDSLSDFFILLRKTIKSPIVWFYGLGTILFVLSWFVYAYHLGQESGNSFFIWGKETDRISFTMLFDFDVWFNLFIRILLRNFAVFGFFFVVLYFIKSNKEEGIQFLHSGLVGMLICTVLSMRSSSVHEYYQLPLQIFFCPMMGRGWMLLRDSFHAKRISKYLMISTFSLLTIVSLTVLSIDYWLVESNQAKIWMPLAEIVRKEVEPKERIVSVTGLDPTLLNLSRRQGWLTTLENVDPVNLRHWKIQGARYIVGSLNWQESYIPLNRNESNYFLNRLSCKEEFLLCPQPPNYLYLMPLNQLINDD